MASTAPHAWLTSAYTAALRPAAAPAGKRIAVVAPHPDDELLGCGGTLLRSMEDDRRTSISVLYLTNGEQGSTGRRKEARRGLAVLGLDEGEHAGFSDGSLAVGPREVEYLTHFLERFSPQIVMIAPPLDPHPDHRAAAGILMRVLETQHTIRPSVWIYEVQPSFPMNALVRIDGLEETKARALAEHRSQNADRLARAAMGLAACRAMYGPSDWKYAEAFRIASAENFVDFCRSVSLA